MSLSANNIRRRIISDFPTRRLGFKAQPNPLCLATELVVQILLRPSLSSWPWTRHLTHIAFYECERMLAGGRKGLLIMCQASVGLPPTGQLWLHVYGFNVKPFGYLERFYWNPSHHSSSLRGTWRRAGWAGWESEASVCLFLTGFTRCPGKMCPGRGSQASGGVLQPSSHLPYVPSEGLTDPHPHPCCHDANGVTSRPVFGTELQQVERKKETKQVRGTHAMEFWTRIVKTYIS